MKTPVIQARIKSLKCREGTRIETSLVSLPFYGTSNAFNDVETDMPIVLRIGPYRFGFFASDIGEPPHIHIRRERRKAKFWLFPEVRLANSERFAMHELRSLRKIVVQHRVYFLERWNEFFAG